MDPRYRLSLEDRLKVLTRDQRQTLEAAKNAHERGSYYVEQSKQHYDRCRTLLWKLRQQGVSIRTLGEYLGLTHTRISALTKKVGR